MKAIIDGKRYDTDAPNTTLVATYHHSYPREYDWFQEMLYRTGRGNWFIYGEGNASSPYSTYVPGNPGAKTGGSRFRALTPTEARVHLESWGRTAEIEQWFADEIEDA